MIVAKYIGEPIAAGEFDHAAWDNCEPVKIEHFWSGDPAPASRHAEARLCWSDEALHVRFVGEQHEPLIVADNPITDRKTLGLWDRDVCEIFVAPDPAHPERYFEFEAAPTGEWVDLGIVVTPTGRETDWEFNSGMTTASKLEGDKLTVGIRIPWSEAITETGEGRRVAGECLSLCWTRGSGALSRLATHASTGTELSRSRGVRGAAV